MAARNPSTKPEQGLDVYLVGGAVRDALLGLEVKDRDWVVVGATPEELERRGFKAVGKDFPVFLHPRTREEYALARTERKTAPGYKGFAFNASPRITLRQDLARRDLTINAMARGPDGGIIDYFGGAADLENGILRHVSEAFVEDPLRVLRVARFAARYDFRVADDTLALMREMVQAGEVDTLVAERVWNELERALAEPTPSRFIETLRRCRALGRVFPEVDALFGVPQPRRHHPEVDTGLHTLMAVDRAAALTRDPLVRFAVLVHDLGKALTPEHEWPSHRRHEEAGVGPIRTLCERLRAPKRYRELAVMVCRYHLRLPNIQRLKPMTVLKMLEAIDVFRRPERVGQFALACQADIQGRRGREELPFPQAETWRRCFEAALEVDAAAIARRHDDGGTIATAVRRARAENIAKVLA